MQVQTTLQTCCATTREQAITDIISSVSFEQTALSKILEAEGNKIQKIIDSDDATIPQLLEVNASVLSMVEAITELEIVLRNKLDLFSNSY